MNNEKKVNALQIFLGMASLLPDESFEQCASEDEVKQYYSYYRNIYLGFEKLLSDEALEEFINL